MGTYSFENVVASITGPGGAFALGSGAGPAAEGITTEMIDDKNQLTVGADGTPMNSLRASDAANIVVRFLKTSPVNALLSDLYNFQRLLSSNWGKNVIVISDLVSGDTITCSSVAFSRQAAITYAVDGGMNEWRFTGIINIQLGTGDPEVAQ